MEKGKNTLHPVGGLRGVTVYKSLAERGDARVSPRLGRRRFSVPVQPFDETVPSALPPAAPCNRTARNDGG